MTRRKLCSILFILFWFVVCGSPLRANMLFPLEIIDSDSEYYGSPDLRLYVQVADGGPDQVDFTFYNDSFIGSSSIARIYFDDDGALLSGLAGIDGFFSQSASPGNLPGARLLAPPFETTSEFSIGADAPSPKNGINPGQSATITFDMTGGSTLYDVIDALEAGTLRAGVHVIALPDGSSGAAVTVPAPEPATLVLFSTAGLWVLTRRRKPVYEDSSNKRNVRFKKC